MVFKVDDIAFFEITWSHYDLVTIVTVRPDPITPKYVGKWKEHIYGFDEDELISIRDKWLKFKKRS